MSASAVFRGSVDVSQEDIQNLEIEEVLKADQIREVDDLVLPGLIDVHTDQLERHSIPRSSAPWPIQTALLSHDAGMIAAGTTTVFDAVFVGGVGDKLRRSLLEPTLDTLEQAAQSRVFRARHYLHLRCDLVERGSAERVESLIDHPLLRFVTLVDDEPARDPDRAVRVHEKRRGLPNGSLKMPITPLAEEDFTGVRERRRRLTSLCQSHRIAIANHDDTRAVHVDDAASIGMSVSEFPITMNAASAAKTHGMAVICGAPNLVRGGSHTNNVAVADLVHRKLVDILCSDYVPSSLLQSIFLLTEPPFSLPLTQAVGMASSKPAEVFGLHDRGEIAIGKKADLVRVRLWRGRPTVHQVWVGGREMLAAPHDSSGSSHQLETNQNDKDHCAPGRRRPVAG